MVKAMIDVGSNSILLLIATRSEQSWKVLADISAVTALGENTKTTGLLSEQGICITLRTIGEFFDRARSMGADRIVAAGTMALRIAANRQEFIERAAAQGTPVAILNGSAEAHLGLLSVTEDPLFNSEGVISIIDVGGHSTELATAKRQDDKLSSVFRKSFGIGTLGLRESLLAGGSPTPADLLAATRWVDDTIGLEYLPNAAGTAVVLGATGTNLASIRERRTDWNADAVHGACLTYEEVGRAAGSLSRLTDEQRASIMGIEPGRERTLHLSALILERFVHAIHVEECRVSARGWRYALLDRDLRPNDLYVA